MKYLQNLHTHSTFCDGKDTPEELVLAAIEKNFDSIGFSGHSYMSFPSLFSGRPDRTEEYKREIERLKKKYGEKIDIFCGLEVEICACPDMTGYDYLIGSAHYFPINGQYVSFDRDEMTVRKVIEEYFSGDSMKYAKAYYARIASIPEYGKFDIIAHFDLVAKHCELPGFLDINAPEYLKYAFDAIDALRGKIDFFEINTGAIARGYRTTPYPSIPIVNRLLEAGFLPVITSDCHDKTKLDCEFEVCRELLAACGAKEKYVLTKNGFCAVEL